MFVLILAASSAFALPSANVEVARTVNRSLPNWVERQDRWTAAELRVFVDPKGTILQCDVERFAGHGDVAKVMCGILVNRRIKPGKDFAGAEAFGLTRVVVVASAGPSTDLPSKLGRLDAEGLVLSVNRLPLADDGSAITHFPLNLQIDEAGSVVACESSAERPEAYVAVACQQAAERGFDAMTAGGGTVPYVRSFEIVFELDGD